MKTLAALALVVTSALALPLAADAQNLTIRIDTPHLGLHLGAPLPAIPVYQAPLYPVVQRAPMYPPRHGPFPLYPAPIYAPPHYPVRFYPAPVYATPRMVLPAPVYAPVPVYYGRPVYSHAATRQIGHGKHKHKHRHDRRHDHRDRYDD